LLVGYRARESDLFNEGILIVIPQPKKVTVLRSASWELRLVCNLQKYGLDSENAFIEKIGKLEL